MPACETHWNGGLKVVLVADVEISKEKHCEVEISREKCSEVEI